MCPSMWISNVLNIRLFALIVSELFVRIFVSSFDLTMFTVMSVSANDLGIVLGFPSFSSVKYDRGALGCTKVRMAKQLWLTRTSCQLRIGQSTILAGRITLSTSSLVTWFHYIVHCQTSEMTGWFLLVLWITSISHENGLCTVNLKKAETL